MQNQRSEPLAFKQCDPSVPQKSRTSKEKWNQHKAVLREYHRQGLTRDQMLDRLSEEHDFRPTLSQLHKKMRRWSLRRYAERDPEQNSSSNATETPPSYMKEIKTTESPTLVFFPPINQFDTDVVLYDAEIETLNRTFNVSRELQCLGVQQFSCPTDVPRSQFLQLFFAEQLDANTDAEYEQLLRMINYMKQEGPENSTQVERAIFSDVSDFLCIVQAWLGISATTAKSELAVFAEVKQAFPLQRPDFWDNVNTGLMDEIFLGGPVNGQQLLRWLRRELKGLATRHSLLRAVTTPHRYAPWSNVITFARLYERWLSLDKFEEYGTGLSWSGVSKFACVAWTLAPLVSIIMQAINDTLTQAVVHNTSTEEGPGSFSMRPDTMFGEWQDAVDQCIDQLQEYHLQDLQKKFKDMLTEMQNVAVRRDELPQTFCLIEQVNQTLVRLVTASRCNINKILSGIVPAHPTRLLPPPTHQPRLDQGIYVNPRSISLNSPMNSPLPSIASPSWSSRSSDFVSFHKLAKKYQRPRVDSWTSRTNSSGMSIGTPASWNFERGTGLPAGPPSLPIPGPRRYDSMDIDQDFQVQSVGEANV